MKHTTKEGIVMDISQMDDNHLINTINLHVTKLQEAKNIIDGISKSKFSTKFYDEEDYTKEAEIYVEFFNHRFAHYIFEATIRNLNIEIPMQSLRDILNRADKERRERNCWTTLELSYIPNDFDGETEL